MITCPVLLLHLTPLHWQQFSPSHELRRFLGSLVMPALNESRASLSAAMQPLVDAGALGDAAAVVMASRKRTSKR
ncbi:hypothetical protein DAI22_01g234400 [Oryza sativa Japonica Group]|nr:hypothetical protein DAI22_01g234400 [Oryza sativa Japonica Group]